jgi:hypothetical protein
MRYGLLLESYSLAKNGGVIFTGKLKGLALEFEQWRYYLHHN